MGVKLIDRLVECENRCYTTHHSSNRDSATFQDVPVEVVKYAKRTEEAKKWRRARSSRREIIWTTSWPTPFSTAVTAFDFET